MTQAVYPFAVAADDLHTIVYITAWRESPDPKKVSTAPISNLTICTTREVAHESTDHALRSANSRYCLREDGYTETVDGDRKGYKIYAVTLPPDHPLKAPLGRFPIVTVSGALGAQEPVFSDLVQRLSRCQAIEHVAYPPFTPRSTLTWPLYTCRAHDKGPR